MTSARTSGSGTGQPNVTLTYGYNNGNARASLADSFPATGLTTYSYDSNYRLTTLTRRIGTGETLTIANAYDDASRLTSRSRTVSTAATANLTTTYQYDSANRLTTISHARQSGGTTLLATYAYAFDSGGRITRETIDNATATFSYDNTNQLTAADRPGSSNDESYAWDSNGNPSGGAFTVTPGNRVTAGGGFTYTYDNSGNMTAKTETATGKVTTYAYDHRNRLTGVTRRASAGGTVEMEAKYTYDPLNRRIATELDPDGAGAAPATLTWTVHDIDNPYADVNTSGTVLARYLHGLAVDELLARSDSAGVTQWYLTDHLGSVRAITDTAGTITYSTSYDAFGAKFNESGTPPDRFGYTAREHDTATGLRYHRARSFDPTLDRWTQEDPISFAAGDANLYRYVGNEPTGFIDPDGASKKHPEISRIAKEYELDYEQFRREVEDQKRMEGRRGDDNFSEERLRQIAEEMQNQQAHEEERRSDEEDESDHRENEYHLTDLDWKPLLVTTGVIVVGVSLVAIASPLLVGGSIISVFTAIAGTVGSFFGGGTSLVTGTAYVAAAVLTFTAYIHSELHGSSNSTEA